MLSKSEVYGIIDWIIECGKGYDILTNIEYKNEGLTRFANSEIHQNVYKENMIIDIKVKDGSKTASVKTNRTDAESIKRAVEQALENLKFVPPGDLEIPLIESPMEISKEAYDTTLDSKFSTMERAKLIEKGINILEDDYHGAGALSLIKEFYAVGNSKGIKRFARFDRVEFTVMVMEKGGSSGYVELNTDKAEELDVVKEFKTAYEKAKMGIDPIELEPGKYTVILEPLAVGDLLSYLAYAGLRGRAIEQGFSFLTGKVGEKVFGDNVTIKDDGNHPNTMKMPFDFEGAERKELIFFDKGVSRDLAYDLKSAIKAGKKTTGHSIGDTDLGGFPFNIIMEGGDKTLDELISTTKKGLLVTRFHYMNIINPREIVLTALTRDGLFLIEDGKVTRGVKNLRFTESLLNALNNIIGITQKQVKVPHFFGVSVAPGLKIADFTFTGKTS